jgi:hypothetical protein
LGLRKTGNTEDGERFIAVVSQTLTSLAIWAKHTLPIRATLFYGELPHAMVIPRQARTGMFREMPSRTEQAKIKINTIHPDAKPLGIARGFLDLS